MSGLDEKKIKLEFIHSGGTRTILSVKTYCTIQQSVELIAKRH